MKTLKAFIKKYFQYFSYFYSHLGNRVFVSLVLSLVVGVLDGFGLAMFLPLMQMVDGKAENTDIDQMGNLSFLIEGFQAVGIPLSLFSILITILFFFSFKGVMRFFLGYVKITYQQYFIRKLRITNADLLARFSYNDFIKADSGRIQNTFSGEVGRVDSAYRTYFMAMQSIVLVLVYIVLAFLSNPKFAFLVSIGGMSTNFLFKRLYAATKNHSKKLTTVMHSFQGLLIQKVTNFKYLKATSLIFRYVDKLKQSIDKIEEHQKKIGVLSATLQAIREPLIMLVVVLVIIIQVEFFGGALGLIILSLLFFYRALNSLMTMQNSWNTFLSVSGSLTNMSDFTKELKAGQESYGNVSFQSFKTEMKLENVGFEYEGISILRDINLNIRKNETIAIIGESGAGKTTLINILAGLIKPINGSVIIDGLKMRELDVRTFQQRIGYITQEPVIFNDTIFNNVTFWAEKDNNNLVKFKEAIKKAAIDEFIMDLELKEDTILGNNGINLSGGQRQRISIARELYKEVDFLMLDEATSALDTETEKAIQDNIEGLKGKYTIIMIAHRLSTIKNADRIILLKKGCVEIEGSFEDIYERSSTFKNMVRLQNF